MNPAAKLILFLLALPILIGVLIIIVPLILFLLILSLFIPSIRVFRMYGSAPGRNSHPAEEASDPAKGEVLEAEYTVVDSTESDADGNSGPEQPKQLKN